MATASKLKSVAKCAEDSPFTEAQIRWWVFNEHSNGMAAAGVVVRIGRRVYINPDALDSWIDSQQPVRVAA